MSLQLFRRNHSCTSTNNEHPDGSTYKHLSLEYHKKVHTDTFDSICMCTYARMHTYIFFRNEISFESFTVDFTT